jgi:glycerol kinase
MSLILALDQGTTSSRAIVFDLSGDIVSTAQQEFTQHFPNPGWVEHDASEIWSSQLAVAHEALARIDVQQIRAIGITNQRETTVVWDRETGEPIHRAIVWQDRRTADVCTRLREEGHESLIRERTGLVLDPYFSGTKLAWILDTVPGARERAERGELAFGTIDSWLIFNLTKGTSHLTDASNASRTLLYRIDEGRWDPDLLRLLRIPESVLPEVCDSSGVVAQVGESVFGAPIPIAGVAGDQQAALFGQACLSEGMAKNTYGTGCFLLMNTGSEPVASENGLLTTVAWQRNGKRTYALEGSVFIGGAVVQWLRDGLGIIDNASDIEPLAASVDDNGGVYFTPAFAGLGAPHWDPFARGSIFGLTRGSTRAHIARAALEAIALQSSDLLTAMTSDARLPLKEIRVDGGAANNNLLMQIQADLSGAAVVRPTVTESTARGAAFLAASGIGLLTDEDLITVWQEDRRFEPGMDESRVRELKSGWNRAVERSKNWLESVDK